jgi:hypothetical protein
MEYFNQNDEITSVEVEQKNIIGINNIDYINPDITDNKANYKMNYSNVESQTINPIIETNESIDNNSEYSKEKKNKKRKLKFDRIHKKIMRNFLNVSTLLKLNEMLYNFHSSDVKKMKKLKQKLITKIDIVSIKLLLKKSLLEIFQTDNRKHNLKIIHSTLNGCSMFRLFMEQTFEQAYRHYIASSAYKYDLERIKTIEDEAYFYKYDRLAKCFF